MTKKLKFFPTGLTAKIKRHKDFFFNSKENWFWHFRQYNTRWSGKFIDNRTAYLLFHYQTPILRIDFTFRCPDRNCESNDIYWTSRGFRCNACGLYFDKFQKVLDKSEPKIIDKNCNTISDLRGVKCCLSALDLPT